MCRLVDPPFCSIIPPHVFAHLSQSSDPTLRATAQRSLQISDRLRAQRTAFNLLAAAIPTTPGALTRQIYSAGNAEVLPGNLARSEGDAAMGDTPTDQAYDGAGLVWTFYKNIFNRDSLDNNGMRLD